MLDTIVLDDYTTADHVRALILQKEDGVTLIFYFEDEVDEMLMRVGSEYRKSHYIDRVTRRAFRDR